MKNRWVAVVRDGVLIGLAVYATRHGISMIEFPREYPFFWVWAIEGVLTGCVAAIGFCISGCLSADRRRWHLPRVLGFVWSCGLVSVFFSPGANLSWALVYWLQSFVPLGLAMLIGGAISYWMVKERSGSSQVDHSAVDDEAVPGSTTDWSWRGMSALEKLLILVSAETSLIVVLSSFFEVIRDRSRYGYGSAGGSWMFLMVMIAFLFVLPIFNFRSSAREGIDNRQRYAINRVVAGVTICIGAFVLNAMFWVDLISPAFAMFIGPLMVPLVLVAVVAGLTNLVLFLVNNPMRRHSSS